MRIGLTADGIDLAALAAELRRGEWRNGRHQLINELLLDVRPWCQLEQHELAARLEQQPLALLAAWELTAAAAHIAKHSLSEAEFLRPFTQQPLMTRLAYLGIAGPPEGAASLPRVAVYLRREQWDALLYLHAILRWAQRFGGIKPHDVRELLRLNLNSQLAAAVLDPPQDAVEALLHGALGLLGVRLIARDPAVAEHHLLAWLIERLEINAPSKRAAQRQLDFREAGGTRNSLFAVRAMGGVDGCDVRGTVGEDLGLIIDIGDREVGKAATAYLEQHVARIINEHTPLSAELSNGALRLRWFDSRLTAEEMARLIYDAIKREFILHTVSVNMIFDAMRIASLRPSVLAYREDRDIELRRRTEEHEPFVICRSCHCYSPHGFCVASVDHEPCCGRSYDELAALALWTRSREQLVIDKGVCQDRLRGRYMGADKAARLFSDERVEQINLHSIRDHPHPTTAIPQCIAWYIDELDSISIMSADYGGRSADGKTFDSLLARVAGKQAAGYCGVSEGYILSPRFLAAEGGLVRVGWMNGALKGRLGLKAEHIATEKDCINLAGLKEFLATWRH